jgi:hypothetical protein
MTRSGSRMGNPIPNGDRLRHMREEPRRWSFLFRRPRGGQCKQTNNKQKGRPTHRSCNTGRPSVRKSHSVPPPLGPRNGARLSLCHLSGRNQVKSTSERKLRVERSSGDYVSRLPSRAPMQDALTTPVIYGSRDRRCGRRRRNKAVTTTGIGYRAAAKRSFTASQLTTFHHASM